MYTIAYVAPTSIGLKLFLVTSPSITTATDIAASLRRSKVCHNIRVWGPKAFHERY